MDVKAVKLELVQKILETEEEDVLEQIKLILEESTQDWWDFIGEDEKKLLKKACPSWTQENRFLMRK